MFRNTVVGVSDDRAGRDAIALARTLRGGENEVTLLHVQLVVGRPAPDSGAVMNAAKRRTTLERLTRLADECTINARVACIEAGSVRDGLHEFARRHNADLLVVSASHLDAALAATSSVTTPKWCSTTHPAPLR